MSLSLKKVNLQGKALGSVEWSLEVPKMNLQLIKDMVVSYRNNQRQWSACTQTRAEVNHSGKKPHPQKGTGRARQGYLGAPQYRGGGRVHAPRPKFDQRIVLNKKERRQVVQQLFGEKVSAGAVSVLSWKELKKPSTRDIAACLKKLELENRNVLVLDNGSAWLKESVRNLGRVDLLPANALNGYALVRAGHVLIVESAFEEVCAALQKGEES